MVSFNSEICWFFGLDYLSIGESKVLKSHTIIVLESTCAFVSSRVCFMKLGVPKFGAYVFILVIFSW
jgi:hypothetical protein